MMTTTKDKLEFALLMGRHTRATLRQVQALMRYAGAIRAHHEKARKDGVSLGEIAKFNRIIRRVHAICRDLMCTPIFSSSVNVPSPLSVKVSGNTNDMGGEGIVVPS